MKEEARKKKEKRRRSEGKQHADESPEKLRGDQSDSDDLYLPHYLNVVADFSRGGGSTLTPGVCLSRDPGPVPCTGRHELQ